MHERTHDKTVSDLGHVIAIHTGSEDDHASHTKRVAASVYDVDGDKKPHGMNGYLSCDQDLTERKGDILLFWSQPAGIDSVELAHPFVH